MARIKSATFVAVLLLLLTAGVFHEVIGHEFVLWDDNTLIYANPQLNPVTRAHTLQFWRHPYAQLYVPVTYSTYALLAALSSREPGAPGTAPAPDAKLSPLLFHLANLLLHGANVLLVFAILRVLLPRLLLGAGDQPWAAGAGALLFALHPVQVESVAWAAELKGMLCGFWSLLALWQYLLCATSPAARTKRRVAYARYALATLCFVLALLSKPSAVALPAVAAALDAIVLRRGFRRAAAAWGPWLVIALAWVPLVRWAQPANDQILLTPLWVRPSIAGDALMFYLGKLVWPLGLCLDYGRTPGLVWHSASSRVAWLVPLVVLALLWSQRRRPAVVACGALFLVPLLPVLGLLPFAFQHFSTVADRYLYLALLGPALLLAWCVARSRSRLRLPLCAAFLLLPAMLSMAQTRYWRDSITLFSHTVEVNPGSWMAHNNLGAALALHDQDKEAVHHFRAAIAAKPDYGPAHTNLAMALQDLGRHTEARAEYHEALRLDPQGEGNLVTLFQRRTGLTAAAQRSQQELRHKPADAEELYNLGLIAKEEDNLPEAVTKFEAALRIRPAYPEAHNDLGIALARRGQPQEAEAHLHEAVRLKPGYAEAHYNYGVVLIGLGKRRQAIAQWQEALRLQPDFAQARGSLARALSER